MTHNFQISVKYFHFYIESNYFNRQIINKIKCCFYNFTVPKKGLSVISPYSIFLADNDFKIANNSVDLLLTYI